MMLDRQADVNIDRSPRRHYTLNGAKLLLQFSEIRCANNAVRIGNIPATTNGVCPAWTDQKVIPRCKWRVNVDQVNHMIALPEKLKSLEIVTRKEYVSCHAIVRLCYYLTSV